MTPNEFQQAQQRLDQMAERATSRQNAPLAAALPQAVPQHRSREQLYRCRRCNDTGWIIEAHRDGSTGARRCECHRLRDVPEVEDLLQAAAIPPRYRDAGFDTFQTATRHESRRQAKQAMQQVAKLYPNTPRGLLLMGTPGTGKTHLSVALLRELITRKRARGYFVDCVRLVNDVQTALRQAQRPGGRDEARVWQSRLLDPVREAEVLVIDDLGSYRLTAWTHDMIAYVIGERYNARRLTILTTNWLDAEHQQVAEDTLEARIGARLRSRLHEMCDTRLMIGEDERRRKRPDRFSKPVRFGNQEDT